MSSAPTTGVSHATAVRHAVEEADPVALLAAVAHSTGELGLLRDEFRPDQDQLVAPGAGLTVEAQRRARDAAASALVRGAGGVGGPASARHLMPILEFMAGDAARSAASLLLEELAIDGGDHRAPSWRVDDLAPGRTVRVAVIGAGMSGLVAAHRLGQVGAEVVVFEKNADVGGTWFENDYPGCRVDVPSHFYSYSFDQSADWPHAFSTQPTLLEYFRRVADRCEIRQAARFGVEVCEARFDDEHAEWVLTSRARSGEETSERFDAVVSAVGQLNRPAYPDIPGRDHFAGVSFHSARWRHDIELAGRDIAVIGTGASAAQFIPHLARAAGHLTVYQRTPPWLLPSPGYQDRLGSGLRWVLDHLPTYARWDRLWAFWRTQEGLLPACVADPDWCRTHRESVSERNEALRLVLDAHLVDKFPDPDLRRKVRPTYPPFAKRIVRDDGTYAGAIQQANVEIVTDPIESITAAGVRTVGGQARRADVLVYGTGFRAAEFLAPMRVVGSGGLDLRDAWRGGASAHLGVTVPGFPNLFLLYGPNTNIVANGSVIFFSECGVRYVTELLRMTIERGCRTAACRQAAHDEYVSWVDVANAESAWGVADIPTWYRNEDGRSAQNWPYSLGSYWARTRAPNPEHFDFGP